MTPSANTFRYSWLIGLVALGLAACAEPFGVAKAPFQSAMGPALIGQVQWPERGGNYVVQNTTVGDVAKAATVALIDPFTGEIVGHTITNSKGAFELAGLTGLSTDSPYILEAAKDLATASVGADVVRVRTLIKGEPGAWKHIAIGNLVVINDSTTALSVIQSLRRIDASLLLECLSVTPADVYHEGTSSITALEYTTALGYVRTALLRDADPVEGIRLVGGGAGTLQLRADLVNEVSITYSPGIGNPGDTFNIYGVGFTSVPTVTFPSGAVATVTGYNSAVIHTTIPANPGSGELVVSVGTSIPATASFALKQPLGGTFNLP